MKTLLEHLIHFIGIFIILIIIDYKRETNLINFRNKDAWKIMIWGFIAIILIQINLTK